MEQALENVAEISVDIETVTPTMAAAFLARNRRNRPVSPIVVQRFGKLMTEGRWIFDGTPYRFDLTGDLLDGQHRCTAQVEYDATLPVLIIRGLPREAQDVMDQGKRRSPGDVLGINGYQRGPALAGAARLMMAIEAGEEGSRALRAAFLDGHTIRAWVDEHPDFEESLTPGTAASKTFKSMPTSVATAVHYQLRTLDAEAADAFFGQIVNGTDLEVDDPVYALREALIKDSQKERGRFTAWAVHSMIIKAWNAHRSGQNIKRMTPTPKDRLFPKAV